MPERSFFAELRKRKVVQAAAIYGAVAWGVTEIVVTVVDQLFLPQWVSTLAVIGFVVGFPVAMFLAWVFDITPAGIRRTETTSRRGRVSIALSMLLLVAGTAGLFYLIKPAMQQRGGDADLPILANGVAVLPFDNATGNDEDDYLVHGLSDELRDQLGRVSGLRIAARSSSIAVREEGADAVSSSQKLGVAHLVEGSLRRRGRLLRVSVQLVDGASGLARWTQTFDRGPAEFLHLQQEIVESIVRELLPDAAADLPEPATRNANANEALLLGRHYEQRVRGSEEVDHGLLLTAIEHYRDAVELDPESALAHSRLAGALLFLGDIGAAEAPIFRALSLAPDLSEVQHTLGLYYFARGMPEARAAFERAVELDPDNPDALESYAYSLWVGGIDENVAELYRRALAMDRQVVSRYGSLGELLAKQGKVEEVFELIPQIERRFEGADGARMISQLLRLTGHLDHAIAWGMRARDVEPDSSDHVEWLAELYSELGDFETASTLVPRPGVGLLFRMQRYDELIDMAELLMIEEPEDIHLRYLLAFGYNATGRYDLAVRLLRTTGLPETTMTFPRMGADWEGFFTLVNGLSGLGELDAARGLASWFVNLPEHHDNPDWFTETYMACCFAVLDRDEEALDTLELILRSPRLPPIAELEDSPCFRKLAGEPRYQAVLEHFEARRSELRERLPQTLNAFGVAL